jgi:hypothetical protein
MARIDDFADAIAQPRRRLMRAPKPLDRLFQVRIVEMGFHIRHKQFLRIPYSRLIPSVRAKSCNWLANRCRARCNRLITVPIGTSKIADISL